MTLTDFKSPSFVVEIGEAVGRKAPNGEVDSAFVQSLLVLAADFTGRKSYDPGPVDGKPGFGTVGAIESFQRDHCWIRTPDGVVDPAGTTFRRLVALQRAAAVEATFPFAESSAWPYDEGMRRFGANRSNGRAHAACDIYHDLGTPVLAVAGGVVVRGPYYYYNGTYAVQIDHGDFLAVYGEIQQAGAVREGDRVGRGDVVGFVGHLQGIKVPSDMLHFEMYDKTQAGLIKLPSSTAARYTNGRTLRRRSDLLDPTPFLKSWALPKP